MSQAIPELPETLRLQAISAGLDAPETDALWENYCRWSLANYPDCGLGGTSWTRQIKMQLERRTTEDTKRIFVAQDRARKKAAEGAAYNREALTFGQWVVGLQARAQRGEKLARCSLPACKASHEEQIVAWAATSPAGGLLEFMAWQGARADQKRAGAPATAPQSGILVSPEEKQRSDLEELLYFDEAAGGQ